MKSQNPKGPLEVQVIKNISCLEFGRNRVWCDFIVITPPEQEPDKVRGKIRAYKEGLLEEIFTRFYHPNETIDFRFVTGRSLGSLIVQDETYYVRSKGRSENELIVHETKEFESYEKLDGYIQSLCK